jgi:hypothetical protein
MTVFTLSGKEYPRKWEVSLQQNMLNTSKHGPNFAKGQKKEKNMNIRL